MNIINHPLCTTSIGAPSDMQDDCSALPVAYHTDEHGTWAISFWKPEAAELAELNAGGGIALQVRAAGRQHPVVSMGVYTALSAIPTGISAYKAEAGSTQGSYPHRPALSMFATVTDYKVALAKYEALNADDVFNNAAIDAFAEAMKAKMKRARENGRGGWDNRAQCPEIRLRSMLRIHLGKGDPVDVGNFAMMLWNRDERTAEPLSPEILAALAEASRTGALHAELPDGEIMFINRGHDLGEDPAVPDEDRPGPQEPQ